MRIAAGLTADGDLQQALVVLPDLVERLRTSEPSHGALLGVRGTFSVPKNQGRVYGLALTTTRVVVLISQAIVRGSDWQRALHQVYSPSLANVWQWRDPSCLGVKSAPTRGAQRERPRQHPAAPARTRSRQCTAASPV
jgi:hypothetical protein